MYLFQHSLNRILTDSSFGVNPCQPTLVFIALRRTEVWKTRFVESWLVMLDKRTKLWHILLTRFYILLWDQEFASNATIKGGLRVAHSHTLFLILHIVRRYFDFVFFWKNLRRLVWWYVDVNLDLNFMRLFYFMCNMPSPRNILLEYWKLCRFVCVGLMWVCVWVLLVKLVREVWRTKKSDVMNK